MHHINAAASDADSEQRDWHPDQVRRTEETVHADAMGGKFVA